MRVKAVFLILLFFSMALSGQSEALYSVGNLRCEWVVNPLGIGITDPQLSWMLSSTEKGIRQTGYEILVSDQEQLLKENKGNKWASGKKLSDESSSITYRGSPLEPFKRYYWKVRVYDSEGNSSAWSPIAWFETAMLTKNDWQAEWIGDGSASFTQDSLFYRNDPMPLFRKDFSIRKKVSSARLYICGLGYHEPWINGKKVGNHVLDPGWTAYGKQALYVTHEVTDLIRTGKNTFGVQMGNGWYNPLPLRLFGRFNLRDHQQTGRPVLKAQLLISYADGSKDVIATDETWLTAPGPIVRNSVYLGECYDGRSEVKGWNDRGPVTDRWKHSQIEKGPDGELTPQMQPPVTVKEIIKPVGIWKTEKGSYLVDMGANFAGVARIRVKGERGTEITLRYGEDIHPDSTLNWLTSVAGQIKSAWKVNGGPGAPADAIQEDRYILRGGSSEEYAPKFTFHAFRYVEIIGWPGVPSLKDIEGLRLSADLEENGSFACSNEMFNQLHEACKRTFSSNVFSVQSDCPGREKMGYGGDMVATAESFLFNYQMANFYRKAIRDFANDQRPEGGMTEIAPYTGIADRGLGDESGPLGWQLAFSYLQKQLYDFYGDKRVIEKYYPVFVKQFRFIQSKAIQLLFHWDIGDHAALDPKAEAFSACAFYYEHARLIARFAEILGKKDDLVLYQKVAEQIRNAVIRKYWIPGTGRFDNATQGAQIFALYYGLSPEAKESFDVLSKEYARHQWHVSTGIFATKMGFDVLRERDENEIAYRLANQRDYPGWGYMLSKGATTLWESWKYPENSPSHNHPMFGSVEEWFYRSLLGINPAKPGFKEILIKPQPAGDLVWAKGSYQSIHGVIGSDWSIRGKRFELKVEVPCNTTAQVFVKSKEKASVEPDGSAQFLRWEDGYSIYQVSSGKYRFISTLE